MGAGNELRDSSYTLGCLQTRSLEPRSRNKNVYNISNTLADLLVFCFKKLSLARDIGNIFMSKHLTRIAAAFIVSGDRLISRIGQYRTLAGNNCISNVDHVTVRHPSSDIRDTQHAS